MTFFSQKVTIMTESQSCKLQDAKTSNEMVTTKILKMKLRLAPIYILFISSSTAKASINSEVSHI